MPLQGKKTRRPDGLSLLGNPATAVAKSPTNARLETFPNNFPSRDYTVKLDCPDFTSLCPVTGQPDFAHLRIEYVPANLCVETKSLKLYLAAYRNERAFNEVIVNRIFSDLMRVCSPKQLRVEGTFAARGGISLTVVVEHPDPGIRS
jgi:7-cyano-7-deazaguanine reductase